MHPQPPLRTTHAYGTPSNRLVYDRWGRFGRPVVLLHGLLFDRTMWWPVAADLGGSCSPIAVDLPAHGDSAARADCGPDRLASDLAILVNGLDLHRAPVLVAHAESARLAAAFADRYATQSVITVDGGPADLAEVPGLYRQFAEPRRAVTLPEAYGSWSAPATREPALAPAGRPGTAPTPQERLTGQRFPHLHDPAAFAALLRSLG